MADGGCGVHALINSQHHLGAHGACTTIACLAAWDFLRGSDLTRSTAEAAVRNGARRWLARYRLDECTALQSGDSSGYESVPQAIRTCALQGVLMAREELNGIVSYDSRDLHAAARDVPGWEVRLSDMELMLHRSITRDERFAAVFVCAGDSFLITAQRRASHITLLDSHLRSARTALRQSMEDGGSAVLLELGCVEDLSLHIARLYNRRILDRRQCTGTPPAFQLVVLGL